MKNTFTVSLRSLRTFGVHDALTGQLLRIITVDGDIVGTPNASGSIGTINVKKGSVNKTYIYNLESGKIANIFTT